MPKEPQSFQLQTTVEFLHKRPHLGLSKSGLKRPLLTSPKGGLSSKGKPREEIK